MESVTEELAQAPDRPAGSPVAAPGTDPTTRGDGERINEESSTWDYLDNLLSCPSPPPFQTALESSRANSFNR